MRRTKEGERADSIRLTGAFMAVYQELQSRGLFQNGVDFCDKTGISTSMLTEIRKGRTGVGESTITATLKAFPMINEMWLRGGGGPGPMLKQPKTNQSLAKQILELKELQELGVISKKEFEMGKRKILG